MPKIVEVNCGHARYFAERWDVYISWIAISQNNGSLGQGINNALTWPVFSTWESSTEQIES